MFASLFFVVLGWCYCSRESSQSILGRPQVFGPSEALVKSVVEFQCELKIYPENETILLQLFKEDNHDKFLGEYTSLDGEVATFLMIIKPYHEGNLECVAKGQNNSNIEPTVSYTHYLKVIQPVTGAKIDIRSGPVEFFEGKTLELRCNITAGTHVSYKWLLNGRPVSQSPLHYAANNLLLIYRTTPKDSGCYMCVATNSFNATDIFTSNSSEVVITVKERVSIPDISFTVLKEDRHYYSAVVACQSTKGTPPVTFSLYNRTELVASMTVDDRNATFKVPLVLDRHLGWLQCQANNGDQTEYSQWIPLEVVTVGGPVAMHYDFDIGENYAVNHLRFYCKAAKGSLPRYQWFLNKTLLHGRGSFYYVIDQPPEQSILLLSVGRSSAGTYHCEVSDSFDNTTAISSKRQYLDKEEPMTGAKIDIRSGPVEFFEGKTLELRCNITAGTHVSYKWLLNGRPVSQSPLHYAANNLLLIYRTTPKDSGCYMCVATNSFNATDIFTSISSEVVITVKERVSIPDISFTVLKEDRHFYSAVVACQSTKGTPPVTFSLYNRTELVASMTVDDRNATFKVPLVLDRHLGWLQCQANNGDETEYSQSIPLEVVTVGGPVAMHYDFDIGENYAVNHLRFYCKAAKGSLPRYQWFLNKTLLHGRGSFYYVIDQPPEQSILLLSVGRSSAGTYHCEVSDSFDNTTAISSKRQYLDKEVLNRLPILVVAVVFGCFTTLILLVLFCCCVGAVYRRGLYGEKSLSLEMERIAAYESELNLSEYKDDADLVKAARGDEFDQASEASVDEWPQIEQEKKTLEDEPVEGP